MKIITSSFSTFHNLDQAKVFYKNGDLFKFITGVPKKFIENHKDVPNEKVLSIKFPFLIGFLSNKLRFIIGEKLFSITQRYSHNCFSRGLAKRITSSIDVFIGCSSFSYEALVKAKKLNPNCLTIIDHASLNEEFELEQKLIEQEKNGFLVTGNSIQKWLIDKENLEHKEADFIILHSNFAKKTFIEKGYKESKLIVIHPSINVKKFKKTTKRDDKFRVLFCGSVEPRKGVHYLLEAFVSLKLDDAELWIIGSLDYLKIDKNFKQLISKYNKKNIIFFNSIDSNKLKEYFSQCSILVLPSISDGFGLVVMQAMACNLPVITSENTGASDLINPGKNGFVVENRNISSIAEQIKYFYKNPDKVKEMGENAFKTSQKTSTWDDYGERWLNTLNKLIVKEKEI